MLYKICCVIMKRWWDIKPLTNSFVSIQPKPGECNSIIDSSDVINTGGVFTLQKDILNCNCGQNGFALKVDGQGTVVKLNGYTVECKTFSNSIPRVIEVVGTANTVMGPGTREYIYLMKSCQSFIFSFWFFIISLSISQGWGLFFGWYPFVRWWIPYCEWRYNWPRW